MKIIAEIGKNFIDTEKEEPLEVLMRKAKRLVELAKESDCDVAKFQTHTVEDEIHPEAKLISPHFNQDRYTWVKRNTFPAHFWWELKQYCDLMGIKFLSTPMSRGAAELLNEDVGIDGWKIGSGDILDFVMLDYIRDTGKPVILSSGMSSFEELKKSYEFLKEKTPDVSIMHCVSQYPCPLESLNLGTISYLKVKFPEAEIGFSDHSLGIEGSLMATKLGATIIEKHFSLDRGLWGSDHKVSLLPNEMKDLVNRIKNDDLIDPPPDVLGTPTKFLQKQEEGFRPIFRKGLYASRDIEKGELIASDMILAMRPRLLDALPSEEYPQLLGKFTDKSYKKYQPIKI